MKRLQVTIASVLALTGFAGTAGAQIVINELLYDGPGTDAGMFTELKGEPGTSLDGYALEGVNGNGGVVYATIDLTGSVIPADGYFVVGQDATVTEADLVDGTADWQNGPDQVRLVQGVNIIDSVCYGSDPDLVCEGGTFAEDVFGGVSLARCPDGSDTDDNEVDFLADDTPTPGAENDLVCGTGVALVINEVLYDGSGTDVGMFTELYGNAGQSLDGHALIGVNGNGGVVYATLVLDGNAIPGDGYFVVAQDATVAEADFIDATADWQNGPDQVVLAFDANGDGTYDITDPAENIDSVCYGEDPDLVCEGGTAAPDVPGGTSIARCPDGVDTDDNAEDFVADITPTPGAFNDPDCDPVTDPTDYTVCQLDENDANGFPVHFGELVRITDVVATVATDVFRVGGLEIQVYQPSTGCCITLFDFSYDTFANPIAEGDFITEVVGTLDFFNGKTEITSITSLVISGTAPLPEPIEITTGEYASNGEAYDDCLIKICGVEIISGEWPADGVSVNLVIDDGTGPSEMRVDSDTDIDGSAIPVMPFTITGIAGQFDSSSPYDEGYQVLPRRRTDIEDGVSCPTPIHRKSWGQIKSQYR